MRILLITPNFFDYPTLMCEELRRMGHEVDWYDDRPSTNNFVKAIIRINKNYINGIISRYFSKMMDEVEGKKYDKVLLISGQSFSFSEGMMDRLRESQKEAEFVLYQWDSMKNFPYIGKIQKYFDRCYSFDKDDVKKCGLSFLPLFYAKRYEDIGQKKTDNYKYDLMFVGTAHPKKYKYIKEMAEKLKEIFPKQFIYFFFPSRLVYIYRKAKNPELKHAHYNEFHYTPVMGKEMDELLSESKCVLDSAQSGQTGLTIRVFETLGARRKIITTNRDVVNYDFYREENVYVYNGEFNLKSAFFTEPYKEIEDEVYKKYSLRSWINTLIEGECLNNENMEDSKMIKTKKLKKREIEKKERGGGIMT